MKDHNFISENIVETIRHGPYKTSANALAELVDNSYDANATAIHVALICGIDSDQPHTIAVLDNGDGMDKNTLRHCIQYGWHKACKTSRSRIGKYGVGLLSASFNQCKDLEVFSWTNGLGEQVNSTRITVNDCAFTLPAVQDEHLPDFFETVFFPFGRPTTNLCPHGTLVLWRDLDRITWNNADRLMEHLQFEFGRIYRNFLVDGSLYIVINNINLSSDSFATRKATFVKPVDPMFLSHWGCDQLDQYVEDLAVVAKDPGKYGVKSDKVESALKQQSLFIPFDFANETENAINEDGDVKQAEYTVKDENDKEIGKYRITASYRRPQIVRAASYAGLGNPRNPSDTKYGKLAKKLRGVSILRAGREIALDSNWLRADMSNDRWIAISLDFDPSLDALFGVANDKQSAKTLASLAQANIDEVSKEDYNPTVLEAAEKVHSIISEMRKLVGRVDMPGQSGTEEIKRLVDPAHEAIQVILENSEKLQKRSEDNPDVTIEGIDDRPVDPEKLAAGLKDATFENEQASAVRPQVLVNHNLKYGIVPNPNNCGSDMFSPINNASGAMIVRFNTKHPLYRTWQLSFGGSDGENDGLDKQDAQQLQEKLDMALTTIRKLIVSYSRAELESSKSVRQKDRYEHMRREWSKIARDLFEEE